MRSCILFFITYILPFCVFSAKYETVDGISWRYTVLSDGTVNVCGEYDFSSYHDHTTAISKSTSGDVTVPDMIDGRFVTGIGCYAFYNCKLLESISVPDSITFVDDHAFNNCTSLTSIVLRRVTDIGSAAFFGCYSLRSITLGVLVGIGGVKTVDVRQQDQQFRLYTFSHIGSQGIVVADDDLIGGHGVIFIDDRQCPQFQQAVQGVAEILVALLGANILAGDQQLGHGVVVFTEELVVGVHQLALTHGGSSLFGGDILGPLQKAQFADTHTDGTGRNQNHLMTGVFDVGDGFAKLFHQPDIQVAGGMGQGGSADFDDNAHSSHSFVR